MQCENRFCIYQSKGKCTIETGIDDMGMCTECVYPEIDVAILEKAKLKLLDRYEKEFPIE